MSFTWSSEQEHIFTTVTDLHKSRTPATITISAIAGSAKTTSLVHLAKLLNELDNSILIDYYVYGNLAAKQARCDFGNNASVVTIHALAFRHTIACTDMHLSNTGYISWKQIPRSLKVPRKFIVPSVSLLTSFCESKFLSIDLYVDSLEIEPHSLIIENAKKLFTATAAGTIPCTHAIYLKLFQIMLVSGDINIPHSDILLIDEANDLNPIMIDIIEHHPAPIRILVGDPKQAIFSFLGCINAFDLYPEAIKLSLTKSFRVHTPLAEKIQAYMQLHIDGDFIFGGYNYPIPLPPIVTQAILSRTNAALINHMIRLDKESRPYTLATKAKVESVFELPLALLRIISGKQKADKRYNHMLAEAKDWRSSLALQKQYPSIMSYIGYIHKDHPDISSAIKLILKYSPATIIETYKSAKNNLRIRNINLRLMTVHTSKGITVDQVIIDDDLNKSVSKAIAQPHKDHEALAELYLGYVAVSRARYSIINCNFI